MIEMDETFQREFGSAMQLLRQLRAELIGKASNAHGEARATDGDIRADAKYAAYESAYAYLGAASGLDTVTSAFADADRTLAALIRDAPEDVRHPDAYPAMVNRVKYLEDAHDHLMAATGAEDTDDLIQRVRQAVKDAERANRLAEVTVALGSMLETASLPEIVPAVRQLMERDIAPPLDTDSITKGYLLAGEHYVPSSTQANAKVYVGRFLRTHLERPIIERPCACGDSSAPHTTETVLNPDTIRNPTLAEVERFAELSNATGLCKAEDR